ncbi:putative endopeptidase [Nakamurella panacisegetis]|uniref:Putative endopeptidase n=1 Tax=Nakamurella panacisegetis TaxID=1090615 RepID=A0A1H0KJ77_9ACTN|nr:M13-type metalloendopeptidase [Nakamurella panacisegetis]SDO55997.1 putative endopeptidase [Nakamurella panacisegetis]
MTSSAEDAPPRVQDDLFRHVNGSWLDRESIPADQSIYGAFHEMRDQSEAVCREIVEEAAAVPGLDTGSPGQLIGDLYASFMDVEAVERAGVEPLTAHLRQIAAVGDRVEFVRLLGRLRRDGVPGVFGFGVDTDPDQPDRYTLVFFQGGLGLPDESYYRDEQYADIRIAYRAHVETMLGLAGVDDPGGRTESVIQLETELAGGHWDRVRSRDRSLTHNPMDAAALAQLLSPELLEAWLDGLEAPGSVVDHVVVMQPPFLTLVGQLLTEERLEQWKNWLTWRAVRAAATLLPEAFVDENFAFYGRTLSGTPELRPRWKRGIGLVESAVGEALGALYVARTFPPESKARMDRLVEYLLQAYRERITALPWMGADTKVKALEKLSAFTPKVGYPPKFRDYAGLRIVRDDLIGNSRRSEAVELDRELAKIGAPVDRDEWFMTPQTVNAYYNPGMNEIVFPAAILHPPFFDATADDATNFGAIGAVIGHEIGHGFDDQGSKYDGTGALKDWWTTQDRTAFEALTGRLIDQYSSLSPEGAQGRFVNGAMTIGENIGDLGGLGIAYQAWLLSLDGEVPEPIEGQTGAQRLFLNWARAWRAKTRPEEVARRLAVDPHSPPEFRCNQVARNLDEFYEAFGVGPADKMWLDPAERVRIW